MNKRIIFNYFSYNEKNNRYTQLSTNQVPNFLWEDNGTPICTENNHQTLGRICTDTTGGAIIVWGDTRNIESDIYVQRITATGQKLWNNNGTVITNASGDQKLPKITSDGIGGAIITWINGSGLSQDIYSQYINSTGNIQWNRNGTKICNESGNQDKPQICSPMNENAIITWQDQRFSDWDIYAQLINSSGNIKWKPNGVVISNASSDQEEPQICSDGKDGAIIVWMDHRGTDYDIYAQKINATGHTKWDKNGTVICNVSNDQKSPQLCSDGNGGAFIIWIDNRTGNWDIFSQRINSSGYVQWTKNGIIICNANQSQVYPQICNDGFLGAIITWSDYRSEIDFDIFAQRINSSGNGLWGNNGTIICNMSNDQAFSKLCTDENGGAIIGWQSSGGASGTDIYTQRINSTGDIKWVSNGISICTESGNQFGPLMVSDNTGGVVLTWHDYRNSEWDIFAQHIKNIIPTTNQPEYITTTINSTESINWTVFDDFGGGMFRIWTNDTNNNNYIWINWTFWTKNTSYLIPINTSYPGVYNYTIEYYDEQLQFGIPNTVIITITNRTKSGANLDLLLILALGLKQPQFLDKLFDPLVTLGGIIVLTIIIIIVIYKKKQ